MKCGKPVLTKEQALALSALRPADLPHYGKVQKQIRRAERPYSRRIIRRANLRRAMGV